MTPISGRTRVVGVWGHPVGHSRSPGMHNAALAALGLDWVYVPFDVPPETVAEAVHGIRALGLVGVNVTVPLKELVLPHLDVVDEEARRIGSVNTIHNVGGRLHGYSTDGPGLMSDLESLGQRVEGRWVYLLGAGGSARAVAFALAARGARLQIANRTPDRAVALAEAVNAHFPDVVTVTEWGGKVGPFDLLVNTTSLGMAPQEDAMPPLSPGVFDGRPFVYDLIYAPAQTRLLREARAHGCSVANGLGMLVRQGALSLAHWTGLPLKGIPMAVMADAVRSSLPSKL